MEDTTVTQDLASSLIEEVQAQDPAQLVPEEPIVSEEPPVVTAAVEEQEAPVEEVPEQEPSSTAYTEKKALFADSLGVGDDSFKEDYEPAPDWTTSAGWMMDEVGVINNVMRGIDQFTDKAEAGDDKKITASMNNLMQGVPEEYRDLIELQPNFEAAERESDRLRELSFRDGQRKNESTGQMLTAGITGFVVDPFNWVPGMTLLKGVRASTTLARMAGLHGAGATTLGQRAAVWSAFGGAEELVRGLPQLASDHTYHQDEYLQMAIMAAAFTGAMPVLGAGLKGAGGKTFKGIGEAAQTMGSNAVYRRLVATAEVIGEQTSAAKGITAKAKALDLAAVSRESAVKAQQAISNRFKDVPRKAFVQGLEEVAEDAGKAGATVGGFFRSLGKAIDARAPKVEKVLDADGAPVVPPARQAFDEAMDTLEQAVEIPKGVNPSAGAAGRQETLGTKVGDILADLKQSQKDVMRKLHDAKTATQRYLDGADMDAEPRGKLQNAIDQAHASATEAVHKAYAKKGLRPQRSRMTNAQGTKHVGGAVGALAQAATRAFKALDSKLWPDGINVQLRGKHAVAKAFEKAGIVAGDGETLQEVFEIITRNMSHVQRANKISQISNEMDVQLGMMGNDLDALMWKSNEARDLAIHELESARIAISNALDMAVTVADNPFTDAAVTAGQWLQVSSDWRGQGNMDEIAKQFRDNKLQRAVKSQYAMLTNSLSSRNMSSGSPLAQWFTHTILETPSGFGGKIDRNPLTAAIYSENMFNAAKIDIARGWEDLMKETALRENWGYLRRVRNTAGNAKTHKDVTRLSEDVMLEMNARNMGLDSDPSPAVAEFVDILNNSYSKLHDLQVGHVDGIHAGNKIKNYQHQSWDNEKLISFIGTTQGKAKLEGLFAKGYVAAGFAEHEADALAKAIISAKETSAARPRREATTFGEDDVANAMPDLLAIVERMRKSGSDEEVIQSIIEKMNKQGGADMPTYAKNRTPIDLSVSAVIDGKTVRIVDLMDKDVPATFIKYAKEATGRRAISESSGGLLTSDKQIHEMLTAMALEAGDIGANVDVKSNRIALQMILGKSYEGQLPMNARRVRDAVSLAGMGGLGESQLAEFGLALNRGTSGLVGLMQKLNVMKGNAKNKFTGIELSLSQQSDKKLMSELQEASGLYQDMYLVDRNNIHFDAAETDTNTLSKLVDTATGGKYRPLLQRLQGRATGYGALRQMEDQIAMASIAQDIAKFMRGEKAFSTEGRLRDMGVPLEEGSWLAKAFKDHVTYKENGSVETLNLHRWSDMDKSKFGVILNRYASQQVQKGFVGESSPEMMNQWVAFMMQFKSYPMIAAEKQQARHLKFADKEAAMGIMLNTVSSAGARILRYQSAAAGMKDEKERKAWLDKKYSESLAKDTFMYMGVAGMSPILWSTMQDAGRDEFSIASQLPVLNYIDGVIEAAKSPLAEGSGQRVARNTQTAMPLGTVAHMNILFRVMSEMTGEGTPD